MHYKRQPSRMRKASCKPLQVPVHSTLVTLSRSPFTLILFCTRSQAAHVTRHNMNVSERNNTQEVDGSISNTKKKYRENFKLMPKTFKYYYLTPTMRENMSYH